MNTSSYKNLICQYHYLLCMFVESHTSLWLGMSQGTDGRPTSSTPAGKQHYWLASYL